jgi:hypothetical protein
MFSVNWMNQQSVVIEKHMLSVNWMDQQSVVIEKHIFPQTMISRFIFISSSSLSLTLSDRDSL